MDLAEFTSTCLVQIVRGVTMAQEQTEGTGATINPTTRHGNVSGHAFLDGRHFQFVEFDVTVTASDGGKLQAGVSVNLGIIKGKTRGDTGASTGEISKVKFHVPLQLPTRSASPDVLRQTHTIDDE